jgi:hypothetical protein
MLLRGILRVWEKSITPQTASADSASIDLAGRWNSEKGNPTDKEENKNAF